MGRQFRGLLPLFQDRGAPESVQEHIMLQKEREKDRHDAVAHDLPVVPVGTTVSYINKDLKTWSIGRVESCEGRSYVVATEDRRLIYAIMFICKVLMFLLFLSHLGWMCLLQLIWLKKQIIVYHLNHQTPTTNLVNPPQLPSLKQNKPQHPYHQRLNSEPGQGE